MRTLVDIDLNMAQVAKVLRISHKLACDMAAAGALPARRIGLGSKRVQRRISADRLREWMIENGHPVERLDKFLESLS